MRRAVSLVAPLPSAILLAAAVPAVADHPDASLRAEGLGPLATALVTGGLALVASVLVVVVVMLLTRKRATSEPPEE